MTTWIRRWNEFPLVFGRFVMPLALGCAMWSAYNAWVILTDQGLGRLLDGWVGEGIGLLSILTTVILTWGWLTRGIKLMQCGIIWTTCMLTATSITIWATPNTGNVSAGYNVPWIVTTALAWMIERRDTRPGRI